MQDSRPNTARSLGSLPHRPTVHIRIRPSTARSDAPRLATNSKAIPSSPFKTHCTFLRSASFVAEPLNRLGESGEWQKSNQRSNRITARLNRRGASRPISSTVWNHEENGTNNEVNDVCDPKALKGGGDVTGSHELDDAARGRNWGSLDPTVGFDHATSSKGNSGCTDESTFSGQNWGLLGRDSQLHHGGRSGSGFLESPEPGSNFVENWSRVVQGLLDRMNYWKRIKKAFSTGKLQSILGEISRAQRLLDRLEREFRDVSPWRAPKSPLRGARPHGATSPMFALGLTSPLLRARTPSSPLRTPQGPPSPLRGARSPVPLLYTQPPSPLRGARSPVPLPYTHTDYSSHRYLPPSPRRQDSSRPSMSVSGTSPLAAAAPSRQLRSAGGISPLAAAAPSRQLRPAGGASPPAASAPLSPRYGASSPFLKRGWTQRPPSLNVFNLDSDPGHHGGDSESPPVEVNGECSWGGGRSPLGGARSPLLRSRGETRYIPGFGHVKVQEPQPATPRLHLAAPGRGVRPSLKEMIYGLS